MTIEEQIALTNNMIGKSKEEINVMFNSGKFNEIVKGFIAIAMVENEHSSQTVKEAIRNMDYIFDEVSAEEARKFYENM